MGWFWILVLLLVAAIIWNVVSSPHQGNKVNNTEAQKKLSNFSKNDMNLVQLTKKSTK
jgi:hypothetical protein